MVLILLRQLTDSSQRSSKIFVVSSGENCRDAASTTAETAADAATSALLPATEDGFLSSSPPNVSKSTADKI